MARSIVPWTLLAMVALVTTTPCAQAQERPDLGADGWATVAAVEAEGAAHPRPNRVMPFPAYEMPPELRERIGPAPELLGGPERRCVLVPEVVRGQNVRSGEFIIGGHLSELEQGKRIKLWWRPLGDPSMDMELEVRGWRLDAADDTVHFDIRPPTAPLHSDTLEPYADEAAFPGSALFSSSGNWIVVGRTGRSWGCFLFSVP